MRISLVLALLATLLAACGDSVPALNARDKARFLAETIADTGRCASFHRRLGDSSADIRSVDLIYDEARKAGCINRDI